MESVVRANDPQRLGKIIQCINMETKANRLVVGQLALIVVLVVVTFAGSGGVGGWDNKLPAPWESFAVH